MVQRQEDFPEAYSCQYEVLEGTSSYRSLEVAFQLNHWTEGFCKCETKLASYFFKRPWVWWKGSQSPLVLSPVEGSHVRPWDDDMVFRASNCWHENRNKEWRWRDQVGLQLWSEDLEKTTLITLTLLTKDQLLKITYFLQHQSEHFEKLTLCTLML